MRVAVVEDDPVCASQLVRYLEQYREESGRSYEVDQFSDGLEIAERYRPVYSIVFMDIEMPHMNGMDAARYIRRWDTEVILIFITNMARYAIRGYEVGALDFVLKPVNYVAFRMKMDKALAALQSREQKSLLISEADGLRRIPTGDIYYMEVRNHRLLIHTTGGVYQAGGSLQEMEAKLVGLNFVRCNKGYLVNLRHITLIKSDSVMVGGDELLISRRRKEQFLLAVTDYYGGGRV
ncbi:MAG: LytR/AlgR family response regulator transcription factor [Candidatus Onthomonas sp.]